MEFEVIHTKLITPFSGIPIMELRELLIKNFNNLTTHVRFHQEIGGQIAMTFIKILTEEELIIKEKENLEEQIKLLTVKLNKLKKNL